MPTDEQLGKLRTERKTLLKRMGIDAIAQGYTDPAANYNSRLAEQITRLDGVIPAPVEVSSTMTPAQLQRVYVDYVSDDPVLRAKEYYNKGIGMGNGGPINPPFQFGLLDDIRYPMDDTPVSSFNVKAYDAVGRVYADNIKQNFQVVDFQMGMDVYNMDIGNFFGADGSADAASYLRGDASVVSSMKTAAVSMVGLAQAAFDTLTFGMFKKKFVDFKERMNLYFEYVNELLFEMAYALGLTSQDSMNGGPGNTDGGSFTYRSGAPALGGRLSIQAILGRSAVSGNSFTDVNSKIRYIKFLINKGVTISETWANTTEEHPLMSSMNEAAQEADAASQTNGVSSNPFGNPMEVVKAMASNQVKQNMVVNVGALGGIAAGRGRMVLPNIWSNSSFTRSYSLTFKFYSPYGDKYSIFENCYVPTICLLAMSTPRQIGKVSFMSPFIIRAYAPGLFACNFGIVESLTITKGDDKNERTIDGLSKVVTVTMNIKDLIPEFTMTMGRGVLAPLHNNNLQLLDWMWIMSGQSLEFKERFGGNFAKLAERLRVGWDSVWSGEFSMNLYQKVPGIGAIMTVGQKVDNAFNWSDKDPRMRSMDNNKVDFNTSDF